MEEKQQKKSSVCSFGSVRAVKRDVIFSVLWSTVLLFSRDVRFSGIQWRLFHCGSAPMRRWRSSSSWRTALQFSRRPSIDGEVFRRFREVFAGCSKFSDPFGPVRMHLDAFGHFRNRFGASRKSCNVFVWFVFRRLDALLYDSQDVYLISWSAALGLWRGLLRESDL